MVLYLTCVNDADMKTVGFLFGHLSICDMIGLK